MQSDEWKRVRVGALERSMRKGFPVCEVCGKAGIRHKNRAERRDGRIPYSNGLQVHHLHYRNLGSEEPADLIVLCTDELHLDANYDAALDRYYSTPPLERGRPPDIPDRVGCHERAHDDPAYRQEVARLANERPWA
jgi:hypothetical protein